MIPYLPASITIENLVRIGFILFFALVARVLVSLFLDGLVKKLATNSSRLRVRTLSSIISNILVTLIYLVGSLLVVGELGFDTTPIVASASVIGIALAFGAQTLVKDWISGFFILIEDQFREGERIEIAGKTGEVERTFHRTVLIKEKNGDLTYVPYSAITTVTNFSRGPKNITASEEEKNG